MEKIIITPEMREIAKKHADERIKYEYDRFHLNFEQRVEMILIGSLGQLAFKKFLDSENIKYEYEFQAGQYDDYDFKINDKIFEIKTSGYSSDFKNLNLQYNSDQYLSGQKKGYYACVQIFINGYDRVAKKFDLDSCSEAVIAGGIEFEKIKSYPQISLPFTTAFRVPIKSLVKIKDLLK